MLQCPRCQALLPDGSAGCGKCGARFKVNRSQPPPLLVEPVYIPDQATTQTSGFNLFVAYQLMFKNYANFKGRTRRRDYWGATLLNAIIMIAGTAFLEGAGLYDGISFIMGVYALAVCIPGLSLSVRRLHDIGKSGATFILALIPIANIYFLVLTCRDSQKGTNKYGANPKGV